MVNKLVLHVIYGYDDKDSKLEDRQLIFMSNNYSRSSDVYNLLLNLQHIEDMSHMRHDSKDGYAMVWGCLEELKMYDVTNVLDFYRFKLETYVIA